MRGVVAVAVGAWLGVIGVAAPAGALVLTFDSDADFLANTNFTKEFGANIRWGNAATDGDWEYSVVDGSDVPLAGGDPKQHAWTSPGSNLHDFELTYEDGVGSVALELVGFPSGLSSGSVGPVGPINALAIRARADSGDVADALLPTVTFDVGGSVNLASLIGDADAEYLVLVDSRLADGFTISGQGSLEDGNGSLPQYGFKVGSVIPEPLPLVLMGSGLLGLYIAGRRR